MEEQVKTGISRNPDGTFPPGVSGNPEGRPADTPEKIIEKKAIKAIIEEYKESLADVLPELSPILKEMAKNKDISAIKEVHDRVMGKALQSVDHTTMGEKFVFNTITYADNNTVPLHSEAVPAQPAESDGQREEKGSDNLA